MNFYSLLGILIFVISELFITNNQQYQHKSSKVNIKPTKFNYQVVSGDILLEFAPKSILESASESTPEFTGL